MTMQFQKIDPRVTITTPLGEIKIRFYPDDAPRHVENFLKLAKMGFYDGTTFHRVVPGFIIQGGDPLGTGTGGPGFKFADEFHPKARHNKAGILSMANSGPHTNGSQFFITLAPTTWLDDKHTVFGEVAEGMDVVKKIGSVATSKPGDRPIKPVTIQTVTIKRD